MSEYDGKQFVGIDLHRHRSVIVRQTVAGVVCASVSSPPLGFLNGWRIAGERLR